MRVYRRNERATILFGTAVTQNFTPPRNAVPSSAPPLSPSLHPSTLRTTPVSSIDIDIDTHQISLPGADWMCGTYCGLPVFAPAIPSNPPATPSFKKYNLFLGFTALVTAATAWSIWGQDMFPKEPDPTGEPESWTDTEMRRWLNGRNLMAGSTATREELLARVKANMRAARV
ncbi:hypothetical protein AC579_875 [Pseudocercospora musae]|uniref:STE24 endopeptidase n=1 Tax=Pseudocercospora musae TaxID=113226 RepID=A0A139I4E5_9PEZI|nr:hypothetical protein AC579_875 [Pseudocercospora musae]